MSSDITSIDQHILLRRVLECRSQRMTASMVLRNEDGTETSIGFPAIALTSVQVWFSATVVMSGVMHYGCWGCMNLWMDVHIHHAGGSNGGQQTGICSYKN